MILFEIKIQQDLRHVLSRLGPDVESVTLTRDSVVVQVRVPISGAGDAGSIGNRLQGAEDRLKQLVMEEFG
jgi:hypothetical protein